jgi:hypothetical protein
MDKPQVTIILQSDAIPVCSFLDATLLNPGKSRPLASPGLRAASGRGVTTYINAPQWGVSLNFKQAAQLKASGRSFTE